MTSSGSSGAWSRLREPVVVLAAVALASVATLGVARTTGQVNGAVLLIAIAGLAWYFGTRAGIAGTILSSSVLAVFIAWTQSGTPAYQRYSRLALATIVGLLISWLIGNLHATRRRLITESEKLRESETFHKAIAQVASDFAFHARVDPVMGPVIDSTTTAFSTLVGYTSEELHGVRWTNAIHPDDRATARAAFAKVLDGHDAAGRVHVVARNGATLAFEFRLHPERAPDGRVIGLIGAVQDVTRDEQRERELKDAERRFSLASAATAGFIYDWDFKASTNRRFGGVEALTGYQSAEIDASPEWWHKLVDPLELAENDRAWRSAIAARVPRYETIYRIRHKSGTPRYVWDRQEIEYDDSGEPTRIVGCRVDITERLQLEDALRRAKEEAERRADEAEEARAVLKVQEQQLQAESLLKDEFLATLSHELRNPLAPLLNASLILRSEAASDRARRASGVLERQVRQLVRLVDDLLDVSRITRGHLELRRAIVDLRDVVRDGVETTSPVIDAARVHFELDLPSDPVRVHADRTRLSQVVSNLLSNAAKFTPPGGHVRVSVSTTPEEGRIVVRDSGIGIDDADVARVFGMFVQLNRDRRPAQSGLGIGLPLVKRIIEMHGGQVSAFSEGRNKGAEFVVILPMATATDETPLRTTDSPESLPSLHILVVDDSADGADSLALLLRDRGHRVDVAYDGRAALERAGAEPPDVMFVDIGMPDLSGYDVARHVRAQPWGQSVLLVALTGWGQPDDQRRALESGFAAHLVKPAELVTLDRILRTRRTAASTAEPSSSSISGVGR